MELATLINLGGAFAAAAASVLAFVAWRRAAVPADVADPHATAGGGLLRTLVAPLASRMRPDNQAELEALRTELLQGGLRSRDAIDRHLQDRVLSISAGSAVAAVIATAAGDVTGLLLANVALIAGVFGPKWIIRLRAGERREAISTALPGAVDLLTTCIEAGLSLENALRRVARDMRLASPVLADELDIAGKEIDAGVSMPDALRRLARRVGLDELSALCGVIAQAHGLGAPIGVTLREYAEASRRQRMSTLEERAGAVAAKLTIPLAVFFLPSSMLIILAPAIVQLARALS